MSQNALRVGPLSGYFLLTSRQPQASQIGTEIRSNSLQVGGPASATDFRTCAVGGRRARSTSSVAAPLVCRRPVVGTHLETGALGGDGLEAQVWEGASE